jgi:hypothetical protein
VVNSVAGESSTVAQTNSHRRWSSGCRETDCLGGACEAASMVGGRWEVVANGGRLVEEDPDGVVTLGAALASDSGVEVMLHVEDIEGVLLPCLHDDRATLRCPVTMGKPVVSGEMR